MPTHQKKSPRYGVVQIKCGVDPRKVPLIRRHDLGSVKRACEAFGRKREMSMATSHTNVNAR